jgi:hypothetical protein
MITFVSATKGDPTKTLLYKSTIDILEVAWAPDNTDPLPVIYNEAIDGFQIHDWIVFVHDDVIIEAPEAIERQIYNLGADFDVIGLAGTREVKLQEPALWHLMGDKQHHRGAVAHLCGSTGKKFMTSFGSYPDRVVLIDGVFMAVKTDVFQKVRFDETNPAGFHFYDLDFSMACHKAGYKVGVGDIAITHASPGLRQFTDEWKKGQKWFLDKWLPK